MKNIIERSIKAGTIVSTLAFLGSVSIQIFARFFLEHTPSWTEEVSRFFFIYSISFASGLALKDGQYVYLDILYVKLSSKNKNILDLVVAAFTILLFSIIGVFGIELINMGLNEKSPTLSLPMAFAFTSILIMSISLLIYAWGDLLNVLKKLK